MRRRARVDANQKEIVDGLREVDGVSVAHTHTLGAGFPDIAVGYKGRTYLFEIKDPLQVPSKQRLTAGEVEWSRHWRGHYAVVMTVGEALRAIGART